MGSEDSSGITRRIAIKSVAGGAAVATMGPTAVTGTDHVDAMVDITNVGASAWEVTAVSGSDVSAATGVDNPEITFNAAGSRYQFNNGGFPNHPLEFRDDAGNVLLSQSNSGTFNGDSTVNWVDNGDTVEFTLTSELTAEMAEYRCTVHVNAMNGGVTVDAPVVDYTPEMGSVSFTSPSDGASVTSPVSFDMTAENFTVEAASNGVRDGAGHLHILVDQPALNPGEVIPNNESEGYYHYGGGSTSAEIGLEPGEHTVSVQAGDAKHRAYNLTDTIQLTVEPPADPVSRFDADGNGNISISELGDAGRAYIDGEISISELAQVGQAYTSSS